MKNNILIPLLFLPVLFGCGNDEQPLPSPADELAVPVVLRNQAAPEPVPPSQPPAQSKPAALVITSEVQREISVALEPRRNSLASNDLALVNGIPVPAEEFYRVFSAESIDALPNYLRREYDRNRMQFIDKLINNKIFEYAASRENFTADPQYNKDVNDAILKVNMRYFYDAYIAANVRISNAEIEQYYQDHSEEYAVPERVRARHILVSVPATALPAQVENAASKIKLLLRRVREGESFAEIAAAESDCPSRTKGGDLGFFSRGQMSPPFEKVAFSLEKNEISNVVETEFGYHIIQLIDRIPERRQSFEESKIAIRSLLQDQKEQALFSSLLQTLTNKYEVIRNEKLIRKLVNSY